MDLNLHVTRGILLDTRTSLNPLTELKITQKNEFPISIWCLKDGPDQSQPVVVIPLPDPYTIIVISARPNDKLDEAELLFYLTDFTQVGENDELHYEGILHTNTAGVAALFTDAAKTRYPALLDIDFLITSDPEDGRETVLKQREFNLYRAMWQGTEGVPPSGNPSFPLAGSILSTADFATAEVEEDSDTVDFDISALSLDEAPELVLSMGVQKPTNDSDNITIVSTRAIDPNTLRAWLSAAPSEPGYKATVLFR